MNNESDQVQENLLIGKGQLQGSQTNRWRITFVYSYFYLNKGKIC